MILIQIASDTKSIKDSLNFMARYIANKKVNSSKANGLLDFDGIGDSIWNFISSIYQANWDLFYIDNKTTTLRAKISSKFTSRIPLPTNKNNKETVKFTNGGLGFSLFQNIGLGLDHKTQRTK